MEDDSKLRINDASSDDITYSPKRRRIGFGGSKSHRILIGILLFLIYVGSILYFFLSKGSTNGEASLLESKVNALEQKIAGFEKQLSELQEKISTLGKVEPLEKQKKPTAESKAKPSPLSKQAVSTEKKYHTVQKGETLYWIAKKYGISVAELRKGNNLSADQPIRTGQKLLVSTGR